MAVAGDVALPHQPRREAERAAGDHAVEGPRLLRGLEHPGHVELRPAGAHGGARGPEGGGRAHRGRGRLGARGALEGQHRALVAFQREGAEPGLEGGRGVVGGEAQRLRGQPQRFLVAPLAEQRLRDLRAQLRAVSRRHAAGAVDQLHGHVHPPLGHALAHRAVERGVADRLAAGRRALLRRHVGQRGRQLGLERRRGARAGRQPRQQRLVQRRRVGVVGEVGEPGLEVGHRGRLAQPDQAVGEEVAEQAPVLEPLGLALGGLEVAARLRLEGAAQARHLGRRHGLGKQGGTGLWRGAPWRGALVGGPRVRGPLRDGRRKPGAADEGREGKRGERSTRAGHEADRDHGAEALTAACRVTQEETCWRLNGTRFMRQKNTRNRRNRGRLRRTPHSSHHSLPGAAAAGPATPRAWPRGCGAGRLDAGSARQELLARLPALLDASGRAGG